MCDNIVIFVLFYHKLTRIEEIKLHRKNVTTERNDVTRKETLH